MGSKTSYLEIINDTDFDFSITVNNTSNSDWDGDSRPDNNFNGAVISARTGKKEREEVNKRTDSAWYSLFIKSSNGDAFDFRNDQKDAFNSHISRKYMAESGFTVFQSCSNDTNTFTIKHYELNDWMKNVDDDTSLLNMSIPGTHESCAIKAAPAAKCQNWNLKDQLEHGVRYMDLRGIASYDEVHQCIRMEHGPFSEPYDLTDVLDTVTSFLSANNTEVVFLQLKQESSSIDDQAYANILDTYYLKNEKWKDFIVYKTNDLTTLRLGDFRGKIILVNRFWNSSDFGINVKDWGDNSIFTRQNDPNDHGKVVNCYIQDVYHPRRGGIDYVVPSYAIDGKMDYINQFFEAAGGAGSGELRICFCSANTIIIRPKQFAGGDDGVNRRTANQHLKTNRHWIGVILFDFIDIYIDETVPHIIENNLPQYKP